MTAVTAENITGELALLELAEQGVVVYCDGSFRRRLGGWGLHAYGYDDAPLKKGVGLKELPTKDGYLKVEMTSTVTPLWYLDAWGHCGQEATNNTAELLALIQTFRLIHQYHWQKVVIFTDSRYVCDGLNKWVSKWQKKDWQTAEGKPVANKALWIELLEQQNAVLALGITPKIEWTKGHANHPGNDAADLAARSGSGNPAEYVAYVSRPEGYHKPTLELTDLLLKKWLVFDANTPEVIDDGHHYYPMFTLNSNNAYGHKKEDELRLRHSKTAMLFGRRMSDATFAIMRLPEPEPHIETLKTLHRDEFANPETSELALLNLDVGLKPVVYHRIDRHGSYALTSAASNRSLTTPMDELVSITIAPPRMALDGAAQFNSMEGVMRKVISGQSHKGIHTRDVTSDFFSETETKGKLKISLKPDITNTTTHLNLTGTFKQQDVAIRALVGIDMPTRNVLNRFATHHPRVTLVVTAEGPECYQFAFLFETDLGEVFYMSPYTRFLLPSAKEKLKAAATQVPDKAA